MTIFPIEFGLLKPKGSQKNTSGCYFILIFEIVNHPNDRVIDCLTDGMVALLSDQVAMSNYTGVRKYHKWKAQFLDPYLVKKASSTGVSDEDDEELMAVKMQDNIKHDMSEVDENKVKLTQRKSSKVKTSQTSKNKSSFVSEYEQTALDLFEAALKEQDDVALENLKKGQSGVRAAETRSAKMLRLQSSIESKMKDEGISNENARAKTNWQGSRNVIGGGLTLKKLSASKID